MKVTLRHSLISICRLALFVSAGIPFIASTAVAAPSAINAFNNQERIEEIVVTATKTGDTTLRTTAITMSAVSAEQINRSMITDVRDIAQLVPSLNIAENAGAAQIFIRGIGTNATFAGSDPSSTVHVDGVYYGRPNATFENFIDIERIEVLKGPQGTLYGRNSVGGNINIITKNPTFDPTLKFQLTGGNYDLYRMQAYISGGLSNKVAGALSVYSSYRDGYLDNVAPNAVADDISDENTESVRGQLLINASDGLELVLRGDYARWDQTVNIFNKPLLLPNLVNAEIPNAIHSNYNKTSFDYNNSYDRESYGGSLTASWDLSEQVLLRSITAYRENDIFSQGDSDATELALVTTDLWSDSQQFSQEANLVAKLDGIDFLLGAFYFDETEQEKFDVANLVAGVKRSSRPYVHTKSWAMFGQTTITLTDALDLTIGIRHTHETKSFDQSSTLLSVPSRTPIQGPNTFRSEIEFNETTPKFSLDYQLNDSVFLYASASKGFKSGGFNNLNMVANNGFSPEFLWAYETGAKTNWLDDRLQANLAGFYYDYSDLQVQTFISPGVTDISNAATATVKGIELDIKAIPVTDLVFSFSGAYLDATYDDYPDAIISGGEIMNASGYRLNNSPKWSFASQVQYQRPVTDTVDAFISAEYNWQDRIFFTAQNNDVETQAAYGLLNINFGLRNENQGWTLTFWGRNLTDEHYLLNTAAFSPAGPTGMFGAPQTYGVRLSFELF